MKNQPHQSLNQTALSLSETPPVKCSAGQSPTFICYDNQCNKNPFICPDQSCKCHQNHQSCPQLLIQSIINKIHSKIIPHSYFQKSIIEKIQQTIDTLSNLKAWLEEFITKKFTHYGLTEADQQLLNLLNEQNITGKQVFTTFNKTMSEQNKFVQNDPIEKKFADLWRQVDHEISINSTKFKNYLKSLIDQQILHFQNSKIVTDKMNLDLISFFKGKSITEAKLLYRASQFDFKAEKFHEKCDNIPHTLTLCQTVYGKIFGGYTPLIWDQSKSGHVKDELKESFVFSLSNKDKFILKDNQKAIYQRKDCGPIFGYNDFYISQLETQKVREMKWVY